MDKSTIQTVAVIFTIVTAAWLLGGKVEANSAATIANTMAIAELRNSNARANDELRADLRELRSLLITHISGHNHGPSVALGDSKAETQ